MTGTITGTMTTGTMTGTTSKRSWLVWLGLVPLGLFAACTSNGPMITSGLGLERPKVVETAPAFRLERLAGGELSLRDFAGKVVVLNFWATWCSPCREELPAMDRIWQRYRAQGFEVIGIAVDRGNRRGIADLIEELEIQFPIPLDQTGKVRKTYEVSALPFSYFIGRDGKFVGRIVGEVDWESPASLQLIEELLR